LGTFRILVVDDHEAVRRGLRTLLSARSDWSICGEAADGLEAVQKVKALRPNVVLMDVSMPLMNGLEATRIIRRDSPSCQVVIVSQNDPTVVARQATEVDAAAYIPKTNLARDLFPVIDGLMAGVAQVSGVAVGNGQHPLEKGSVSGTNGNASGNPSAAHSHPSFFKNLDELAVLFSAIVDSSDDAIISKNLDGTITSWNRSAEKLFGYTAAEAIGQPIVMIVPEDHLQEQQIMLENVKHGQPVEHFETVRVRKDGKRVDVSLSISPLKDAQGRIVGASKVARDISRRKLAENATALLAAIVDSSDDAIISKSLDGIITSWNKSAERLFGFSAAEAIGKHITLIVPPDRRHEEATIIARLKRGEMIDHFETVRMRKNGSMLDISLTISPVKDDSGRVIGASKVARDVTERRRAENALRESEENLRVLAESLETQVRFRTRELEQQSQQLRELSNRLQQTQDEERRHIARELHDSAGQIVTALAMNMGSIAQKLPEDVAIMKSVRDSEDLIQQLAKEIRTMSYLLHPPLLDENGLAEALRWYIAGLMERNDLAIELEISPMFGRLPNEIELAVFRIVQEALTNIYRHSGSKTAAIRLRRVADRVQLEVEDYGKGMSAEKLVGLHGPSSGVGITGIRERIRHLKGTLRMESSPTGTKVLVEFPA
jgi:PAS domain S-box-containing protein